MEFMPQTCQYVQSPWLLQRHVSVVAELLYVMLTANCHSQSELQLLYAADTDKESNHILHKASVFLLHAIKSPWTYKLKINL
jgi:hypothetical protein